MRTSCKLNPTNIYETAYFETMLKKLAHSIYHIMYRVYAGLKYLLCLFLQALPISSIIIGPPKGYHLTAKDYCDQHQNQGSVSYTPCHPTTDILRRLPGTIHEKVHWKFLKSLKHTAPGTFCLTIPNGRVLGHSGTVITDDDKMLFDVSYQFGIGRNQEQVSKHQVFQYLKLPRCRRTSDTCAVLATDGGHGYFHWLTDALPRLHILEQSRTQGLEGIDRFLINGGMPVISESLECLGISSDKLLFTDAKFHYEVKTLLAPSLSSISGNVPTWACHFLRDTFLKQRADVTPMPHLYISRSKANYRNVINEDSVRSCLSEYGFTPVNLEDYDFKTQIAILSQAEFVVAPHGAGLTNLIWCNPNTKVLEFFSPSYVNVCFWAIANQLELQYCYLIGEGERPPEYQDRHNVHENILISTDKLERSLDLLMS